MSDSDRNDALVRAEEFVAANEERQNEDAVTLRPGQCPGCGAYRLDGTKPQLHEPGCPWTPFYGLEKIAVYRRLAR